MRRPRGWWIAWALGLAAASPAGRVPPAPEDATVDKYFGQDSADPYRWMEARAAMDAPWTVAQLTRTRTVLVAIPGREALRRHMDAIAGSLALAGAVTPVGRLIFFRRRDAGETRAKLVLRDSASGRDRVLLDPNRITLGGRSVSIGQFAPSQDGRYVAVGVRRDGMAGSVLDVLDADTGRRLPDQIDRTPLASVSWLPDGRSFFYNRLRRAAPGGDPFAGQAVFLHRLGEDPGRDEAVFGAGLPGLAGVAPADFVAVAAIIGTRRVLGIQNDGVSAGLSLYLGELPEAGGRIAWQRLTRPEDGVIDVAAGRDTLYLRSRLGAPRYKVLAIALNRPSLAAARLVVAPSDAVLTSMAVSAGALWVAGRSGASSSLVRVGADGRATPVRLPLEGSIAPPGEGPGSLTADPRVPGAIVGVATWTAPASYYALDDTGRGARALSLAPSPPGGAYAITETGVRADDGRTRIPLSIVAAPGTPHDRRRAVLVEGYGAYGVAEEPDAALIPVIRAWVDAGGVMAIAHGRGGGELGEDWHAAGARLSRQTGIHDFIDCATAMIGLGYASPATLAVTGTGAGGVPVGGAIVQGGSLFRAAYVRNGLLDPVRHEAAPGAVARVAEFGTMRVRADAATLLGADPYQHVRDGAAYPAVLLSAAPGDVEVPFWHSAKMAARLQAADAGGRGPVLLESEASEAAAQVDGLAFLMWQLGLGGPSRSPQTPRHQFGPRLN